MKKSTLITITALISFGMASCATTHDDKITDDAMKPVSVEPESATCVEGDPSYPKCKTGGGLGGPIAGQNTEATCTEGDPGYPKCTTGGGLGGPIAGQDN